MTKFNCPECEVECEQVEACSPYSDMGEPVWICINKTCCRFDKIVFDMGDAYDKEIDEQVEREIEEVRIARSENED